MEKTRLALVLAAAAVAGCFGPTVHTASYATFAEARDAGAIQRGWVPAILPATAYELRAAYAVSGSERWGLFNFRTEDAGALRAILRTEEVSIAGTLMDIPARIEWWPVLLRGRLDEERIRITGLQAYRSTDDTLTFLINWKQGRGYYWRN